jgi:hypothetical protein
VVLGEVLVELSEVDSELELWDDVVLLELESEEVVEDNALEPSVEETVLDDDDDDDDLAFVVVLKLRLDDAPLHFPNSGWQPFPQ